MTKSADIVARAAELAASGCSIASISRQLGVSRSVIRGWLLSDTAALIEARRTRPTCCESGRCSLIGSLPPSDYAYLLGLYLGDGSIARHRRAVYRLTIDCCDDYPHLMDSCERAITRVMPANKVGRVQREGCTGVNSYSKHWPCLFPQHGSGRKHERHIVLAEWQQTIVDEHPHEFLRGLVHSDGCRCMNRVYVRGRHYQYPRYFFTNHSADIRAMFGATCERIGVEWRPNNKYSLSVARRASVAILDEFIGPKS